MTDDVRLRELAQVYRRCRPLVLANRASAQEIAASSASLSEATALLVGR